MKIKRISFKNFRNISCEKLNPSPGINIIYGDNAQGKTNIIEGLWLFTGDRSFRSSVDGNLIKIDADGPTELNMDYESSGLDINCQICLYPQKKYQLNYVKLKSRTNLSGEFYAVIFSPNHLSLIKNGPDERRKFIDQTICQLKPKYIRVLHDFNRVIYQRNSLLKNLNRNQSINSTLDVWDYHLARLTSTIVKTRYTYLKKLSAYAVEFYRGISSSKEELSVIYNSKFYENGDLAFDTESILKIIKENRKEDIVTGTSNYGAHRDDVDFMLDNRLARSFASQGQQRSIVLALKLAECEMIMDTSGEEPIVLLDDVMSELDESRRDYILNKMGKRQVFITCCDKTQFEKIEKGKAFLVENGKIIKESFW